MLRELFDLPNKYIELEDRIDSVVRENDSLRETVCNLDAVVARLDCELDRFVSEIEDLRKQRDMLQEKLFETLGLNGTRPVAIDDIGRENLGDGKDIRPVSKRRMPWSQMKHELEVEAAKEHGDRLEKYWKDVAGQYKPVLEKPNVKESQESRQAVAEGIGTLNAPSDARQGVYGGDTQEETAELRKSLEE